MLDIIHKKIVKPYIAKIFNIELSCTMGNDNCLSALKPAPLVSA
jgi:hypothetical protein